MKSIYLGVLLFSLVAFVSAKTTLGFSFSLHLTQKMKSSISLSGTKQVSFGGACFFKCPNPDEVPMPIPDFQAVPDGCKLGGITVENFCYLPFMSLFPLPPFLKRSKQNGTLPPVVISSMIAMGHATEEKSW